ncbi:hypothetical protein B296_00016639 [Ensete ventricosum]|uniref:Uncharacterized protein n=1 Tax=Ensete ventricosum TaxID=4639 RepID=A0A427A2F9_ENSVE|nr:hypothetical protein B296_00016639 [Ensete ventricosum]
MCVLQANQPGGRVVELSVGVPNSCFDPIDIHGAIRIVLHRPGVHATDGRDASVLVDVYVGVGPQDDLAAADLAMDENRDKVAHGARGNEDRRFLPHDPRDLLLEPLRRGVSAQDHKVHPPQGSSGGHVTDRIPSRGFHLGPIHRDCWLFSKSRQKQKQNESRNRFSSAYPTESKRFTKNATL